MTQRSMTPEGDIESMPDEMVTVYFCECGEKRFSPIPRYHGMHTKGVCRNGEKSQGIYELKLWKPMP